MNATKNRGTLILVVLILFASTMLLASYLFKSSQMAFPIYTADSDTYQRVKVTDIRVTKEAEIDEILDALVKGLSEKVFKLPMSYEGIEMIFGQKIAIVTLHESSEENATASWRTGFFQGSTGGMVTSVSLEETMLQRDYTGDWIVGVKFLYKGVPIEFEHVSGLSGALYRSEHYVLDALNIGDKLGNHFELESKTLSEDGRTITYALKGDFDVNGRIYYFEGGMEPWLEILESPIRGIQIEIGFEEEFEPYIENFRYYLRIANADRMLDTLEKEYPDRYETLVETGIIDASMRLRGFSSILWAESELYSESVFVEFLK